MIGCLVSNSTGAFSNLPPTRRIPSLPNTRWSLRIDFGVFKFFSSEVSWHGDCDWSNRCRVFTRSEKEFLCTCLNISFSAVFTSWTAKAPVFVAEGMARLFSYLTMNHNLNRRSQAVTFRSVSHEENRWINLEKMPKSWFVNVKQECCRSCLSSGSSSVNSCWWRVGSTGQEFSLCFRNWGPLNHLLFTFISSVERPLLASSAGFSSEPTCLHWWDVEFSWMMDNACGIGPKYRSC